MEKISLIDSEIRNLRRKINKRDEKGNLVYSDEEAYLFLEEVDKLQRARFRECGSFLPASDGQVHIYDLDLERFFYFYEGAKDE